MMTTLNAQATMTWWTRGTAWLRPGAAPQGLAAVHPAMAAPAPSKEPAPRMRPLRERLEATLGRTHEALSPRMLRRILAELQAITDSRISEVEAGRRAHAVAQWYAQATPQERRDCWLLMTEKFAPDAARLRSAREHYERAVGSPGEGQAEIQLRRAMVSPRSRLLQRFAAYPQGMRFLVDLRAELLPQLKGDPRLLPLDAELEHLFSTWFDVGFLELRRISWDSPASLIEKLIRYEAVHDIRSWADVKNRLDSDRRCYGFFHPRLEDEPLIFVEVALVHELAGCITPLLDEAAAVSDPHKASTAIFYSISNTQTGLRGVSFGDSLIKRVVETLAGEFPRLKTFATLSPIPGLRPWVNRHAGALLQQLDAKKRAELARVLGAEPQAANVLAALEQPLGLDARSPLRALLLGWCAQYLGRELQDGRPLDAVARFHLGNGARIERLNWAGDPSSKGLKQSFGLMVNYLYDLKRLDRHRGLLGRGQIPMSKAVEELYL
ncbi:malonyl-CoA decarboxylase [Ramlibacter tataouinensis]|uniref:Malonyl-CoA decarboxylase (Malonyl-CoA carboxy-lyase)-like protein n=1 Tax=Ramlibacter tataouinensis (strain ATCC BAA-407 / DSM 14655 / LMG 21543 / TTB310) TaxID=365046 RepID=F5Y5L4_RAMTT|nr:malonyl-CoA decarboxylase [Ramlibacter tataouinensis]AEG92710.1 malonyl-CoA decarboxylase (Malonyl-CoA carboxy-lyase)-like protein [Ramlibacter tataouinensis TTB310]